jgi:hypothetical protein
MTIQNNTTEPSPASAGSQADAYEIRRSDGALEALTTCVRMAEQILRCIGVGTIIPLYRQPQPTLTDAERVDVAMWLSECLRQCSLATDGGSEEVAERWRNRSKRAAEMLERLK